MVMPVDVQQQLSKLFGHEVFKIRKTADTPHRISAFDLIMAVTGSSSDRAKHNYQRVKKNHSNVCVNAMTFRFPGRGQRDTPVIGVRDAVDLIMLLPGHQAASVRRQAASLLVCYLGGDISIVNEVCTIRGFQEHLETERIEGPRRAYGQEMEALGGAAPSQMVRACTEALAIAIPGMLDEIALRVDERFGQIGAQQRINLNVRAPKRQTLRDPPIAKTIEGVGRPLPLAKFLDQKELADPSWRGVRRSLAPFFGMQMQILKKTKLQNEGAEAIYVEQNHRPQLLYTENDRELMQEAWGMMAAHREDLVRRSSAIALHIPLSIASIPSVLDMLQNVD